MLRRVLPLLLTENASFKVARSVYVLSDLNEGFSGPSQVGKFITIYPNNHTQAVRLAVSLDEATQGLDGPAVPSDRPLKPGSLVYYRYGGFSGRHIQTLSGRIIPAIVTPDGELVPDNRLSPYSPPEWAIDPFITAGVAAELSVPDPIVSQRYLTITKLHQSSQCVVYLAVDIKNTRSCVLKQVRCNTASGPRGYDAGDRLRHEAEILSRLAPDSHFPRVFELIEHDGDLFLALEDLEGETLESYIHGLAVQSRFLPGEKVVAWGRELTSLLEKIHACRLVYGDLKSTNVIVAPDGRLCLIDFESANELGSQIRPYRLGTRGYMSPQQATYKPASVTDDIYSLGALLYFIATGAEPSRAPVSFALLNRPLTLLNPAIGTELAHVVARCLELDPANRFPSIAAVNDALAHIGAGAAVTRPPFGGELIGEPEEDVQSRYRVLAHRLGISLGKVAHRVPDGSGLAWVSEHQAASGLLSRDLNTGSAGVILALAELVSELNDPQLRAVLVDGARWLSTSAYLEGLPLPGLYVGEAGIGAALLRAGQVLRDKELIGLAAERSRWISTLPYLSPDLYNGTAGRLRLHLLLWDETGDSDHLQAALKAGQTLLDRAEDTGDGGLRWTIPLGYDGLSNIAYLGYAHGIAGIADTLLDLFDTTGEKQFLTVVQRAGGKLAHLAVPVLEDESGLDWPSIEGESVSGGWWCHGAAGVGRFFLHAARLGIMEQAFDLATKAARTAARGGRWMDPVQCHGLASNIEFLLDMFQATNDQAYLSEAYSLGHLLKAFGIEKDGLYIYPSESPIVFTPDYMVGYAGVVVCLLRLSNPEHLPHQLSRHGFRYPSQVHNTAISVAN